MSEDTAAEQRKRRWTYALLAALLALPLIGTVAYVFVQSNTVHGDASFEANQRICPDPSQGRLVEPVVARLPEPGSPSGLEQQFAPLAARETPLPHNVPGTWSATHHKPPQSALTFRRRAMRLRHRVIHGAPLVLQPVALTSAQLPLLTPVARYLSDALGVPVRIAPPLDLGIPPDWAHRRYQGYDQWMIGWLLFQLRRCKDPEALATLAMVGKDLWPGGAKSTFGLGIASDRMRLGMFSVARLHADENGRPVSAETARFRAFSTASHEGAHLLGLSHCAVVRCNMNGADSFAESDRTPLTLCRAHLARLTWSTGAVPTARAERLATLCAEAGISAQVTRFEQAARALRAASVSPAGEATATRTDSRSDKPSPH